MNRNAMAGQESFSFVFVETEIDCEIGQQIASFYIQRE